MGTKTKIIIGVITTITIIGGGLLISQNKRAIPNTQDLNNQTSQSAPEPEPFGYIEIIDGCGPYYDTGTCINMRSGPGTHYPVVERLRTGMVLRVEGVVVADTSKPQVPDRTWYKVLLDKNVLYPYRLARELYVAVNPTSIRQFADDGEMELESGTKTQTSKRIIVDLSEQTLYAYDGDTLFMQEKVSTGLEGTRTPRGTFPIFRKTPSRYMQGPLPGVSDQEYDLPGVPWDLYFTSGGAVIHGAYWHDHFGERWSHGCVNLHPQQAQKLYHWAELGVPVIVRD